VLTMRLPVYMLFIKGIKIHVVFKFVRNMITTIQLREDINLEIRKRKFRWIGHTLRKEDGEVPKAALI